MRQTCINCQHADYRTAAAEGMPKFSKCRRARNETEVAKFYGRDVECDNGAFAAAAQQHTGKLLALLADKMVMDNA